MQNVRVYYNGFDTSALKLRAQEKVEEALSTLADAEDFVVCPMEGDATQQTVVIEGLHSEQAAKINETLKTQLRSYQVNLTFL